MRNRITALIIDPEKNSHDYSLIKVDDDYYYGFPYGEHGFDINVIDSTDNILSEINKFKGFDCMITVGPDIDFEPLNNLPFEIRKKWIYEKTFNPKLFAKHIVEVFLHNINRDESQREKLFSVFTCAFNTSKKQLLRLYESLKSQTYKNWNWYILDDSTSSSTSEIINNFHDPRIFIFKNISNHGNIGFNKHMIGMMCDGDYLVEVDHDDELMPDCFKYIYQAFTEFPDTDFVYSYAIEDAGGIPIIYGDGFAYGLGEYKTQFYNGNTYDIPTTPDINAVSIRGIHAMPNHVRCWKKEFYHSIGGHNIELSVLDDMDILIRTFLYGKITKIDKFLYIQHEGEDHTVRRQDRETAQSKRFKEIQRTNEYLRRKYDKQIHERVLSLCGEDAAWIGDEITGYGSVTNYNRNKLISFNHILKD